MDDFKKEVWLNELDNVNDKYFNEYREDTYNNYEKLNIEFVNKLIENIKFDNFSFLMENISINKIDLFIQDILNNKISIYNEKEIFLEEEIKEEIDCINSMSFLIDIGGITQHFYFDLDDYIDVKLLDKAKQEFLADALTSISEDYICLDLNGAEYCIYSAELDLNYK
jgi:hypothetical protein